MDILFERHDEYLSTIPMDYIRDFMNRIDWSLRLIAIKGPKGVGKSTLMMQYIKGHFSPDDRHVLYCSADTSYFYNHTLVETADEFCRRGGRVLFIDEIHKYDNWSREVKEIYDLHRTLQIVISGSSLLQINDGQSDLSRRIVQYEMPGLSFREFLCIDAGVRIEPVSLDDLLNSPNAFCREVCSKCRPFEFWSRYLRLGYYPFYFENKKVYATRVDAVVGYIIDVELVKYRGLEAGNSRKIKALLQVLSQMVPYEVDASKLSRIVGIQRATVLRYMALLEEAALLRRLFTNIYSINDLQKPDKILLDNPNLLYVLAVEPPAIGTVRETFFCNQLSSAGHRVEYGGLKTGDYRIDGDKIVEIGGRDKDFRQLAGAENGYVAADDIESAMQRKIPLWAFGMLY